MIATGLQITGSSKECESRASAVITAGALLEAIVEAGHIIHRGTVGRQRIEATAQDVPDATIVEDIARIVVRTYCICG